MSDTSLSRATLIRAVLIRFVLGFIMLGALLFVPPGTLRYWQAWVYLGLLMACVAVVGAYLFRRDPALLERRMRMREREAEQKRILKLSAVGFILIFLLPGFDRRFGWSHVPVATVLVGDALVLLGYGIFTWVTRINSYASRVIEVNAGQQVIRTGPYALVRHPMYVGAILLYLATPLALGSFWALIPALVIVPYVVARIRNEEAVLARDLPGYSEYMQTVPWRLLPSVVKGALGHITSPAAGSLVRVRRQQFEAAVRLSGKARAPAPRFAGWRTPRAPGRSPMLTLDLSGAVAVLAVLERALIGQPPTEPELDAAMAANAFLTTAYAHWAGGDPASLRAALRDYATPERLPEALLPRRLAEGYREALADLPLMRSRLAWLAETDLGPIAARLLDLLPADTPLDATIHITVDRFNNGFVYRGDMGVSLLHGASDPAAFSEVVSHELHHVGLGTWAERDPLRRGLMATERPCALAIQHVQNLLAEGLANYYISPRYVFRQTPDAAPATPYEARLARLEREEPELLARCVTILAQCLAPEAAYAPCHEAVLTMMTDREDAMLPAGHYLGARMVQTMAHVHPREAIVDCVRHLPAFLPLYNAAARQTGAFVWDEALVARFGALWEGVGD